MQIMEASLIGLRAARITFRSADEARLVTLFPMIHAAEPAFYEAVFSDAFDAHDIALTEGLSSPVVQRITRSYRWMVRRGGPLVLQESATPKTGRARRIHADLAPAEFERLWARIPLTTRVFLQAAAPMLGLSLRIHPNLAKLARRLELDDLTSRDAILGWSPETAALDQAILHARDERLVQTLKTTLDDVDPETRIAVVYGAAHIPAVTRALPGLGFTWTASEWITAFHI